VAGEADGADTKAHLITIVAKDASDTTPFVLHVVDVLACMGGGSGCVVFAYVGGDSGCVVLSYVDSGSNCTILVCDVTAAPGYATSVMGTVYAAVSVYNVTAAHGHTTFVMSATDMAVFVYDVVAAPGHATSTPGTLDVPSYVCSPMEAIAAGTSIVATVAARAPLLFTSHAMPDDSWRTTHMARVFPDAICRGATCPLVLQKASRST
jgi:hypothetical protein